MVRSLFGNSNRKLRSTFWGSPFIPVGTNQTECCLPLTNFSVPSRFQTHARQIRPSFGFKPERIWHFYGKLVNRLLIAYHYAFDTPAGFFCQMVSTLGVKVVRFLKTSRNSTYQRGLHKWRGRCVFNRTTTTTLSTTTGSEIPCTAQARFTNFVVVVSSTTPNTVESRRPAVHKLRQV